MVRVAGWHQCRYGGLLVDLDATYKTTEYGIPLFILVVVDNHGQAQVAGMFCVQDENDENVTEALQMLRRLNPTVVPQYWMVDKSQVEQNSINAVYPESKILLCDFHR